MNTSAVEEAAIPDLSDPASFVEGVPHDAFQALRARPGLYWQPTDVGTVNGGYWAVTRFEDIVALEKDPSTFSSTYGGSYPLMSAERVGPPLSDNLMTNDPPRHSSLRRVAATGFGPRIVANFEPWIRDIVREVIDSVQGLDQFNYVEKFARTIPAYVIARALGCPAEDRQKIVDWTMGIFAAAQQDDSAQGHHGADGHDARTASVVEAMQGMYRYAAEIQEVKRKEPADDMFTALGSAVDRGELSQPEFIQWMMLMMAAGFETTHTAIGQSMRMYLEDPAVRDTTDRAVAEGRTAKLAEEFIRVITPAMQMARKAVVDTELAGTKVSAGDVMVMYFVSANRDEKAFKNPDTFDPWRSETATLAFGSGIHRCIGSYLAKLEVQILWEELSARGEKYRLAGTPERGWSNFINQLQSLPVARVR
ncbi:cytochrome P450 [Streptomyces sp. JV176]|uniref:cytochrome P450 n=1 Tax=Streptomyces sp. JV176 TaxID=858630 RepID=UPI002E797B4F|nr:cytochrome P450 [Streptomyces sp. JV176]MEE1799495.1 cytochrome P450 [Streptomyces sp. JV176]